MNILLLNPNMTVAMTDAMTRVASSVVGPGTVLKPVTAQSGFPTSPRAPRRRWPAPSRWT